MLSWQSKTRRAAAQAVAAIISNSLINLSPDKSKVLREAHRALMPDGRLTVSDIVSEGVIPDQIKSDPNAWEGCITGALEQQEYGTRIKEAGSNRVQALSSKEFYLEGAGSRNRRTFLASP